MSLASRAKGVVIQGSKLLGLTERVLDSAWRARRLLIICWHKISVDDEHIWNPALCMSRASFVSRLKILQKLNCTVLPLASALELLWHKQLPPRSVALTFDDGDSSFFLQAWPSLRECGFPATLYWTTYYSVRSFSVFDPMLSYLLWKGRHSVLALKNPAIRYDLRRDEARERAFMDLYQYSVEQSWSSTEKEAFLEELSQKLKVDYLDIRMKRILQLINTREAGEMVAQGLDLQLHTHRHRVPRNQERFTKELHDNTRYIVGAGAPRPLHFCYPSGSVAPEFGIWLEQSGIRSATTCQPGIVDSSTAPYLLPRFLDKQTISDNEFVSWLSGMSGLMSRTQEMDRHGFG